MWMVGNDHSGFYCNEQLADLKIIALCRLLFCNTNGGPIPALGQLNPAIDMAVARKEFPLYPLAISDGVPFLLFKGMGGSGRFTTGKETIKQCETLEMCTNKFAVNRFRAAAEKLIQSDAFRRLYKDQMGFEKMAQMVVDQCDEGSQNEKRIFIRSQPGSVKTSP